MPVDMGFLPSALDNTLYLLELSVLEGDSKGLHKQQMDGILEVLTVSEIIILVVHEFHRPGHVEYALQQLPGHSIIRVQPLMVKIFPCILFKFLYLLACNLN